MCLIELVDFNETMQAGEAAKAKTTRRRRAPKKKAAEEVAAPAAKDKAAKAKAPEADNETKE
jgi:large subunit ribosomal protein L17